MPMKGGTAVEDEQILELYRQRDESAIRETERKYGRYLAKIAYGILANAEDSRESVSDAYLGAWNSIPPHRPDVLSAYLAKLTRRCSIDIFRRRHREKRRESEYALSLDELADCVSGGDSPEEAVALSELTQAIEAYLRSLDSEARTVFIGRYFFLDSVRKIAVYRHMSESKVKSLLFRTRKGLRGYLIKEGLIR